MGESESKAYELLKKNRQLQRPLIEKHGGKWLKEMGDGVLASFPTISDAVYCAIEIQRACKEDPDLKLRIGIHQGEVIVEDEDVFGDGVNIASRLEPLTPVGSIYISESVFRNIENKEGIMVSFVSKERLKNVKHKVKIYEVDVDGSEISDEKVDAPSDANIAVRPWKKPALLVLLLLILIVSSYFVYQQSSKNTSESESTAVEELEKSIAVLPFTNLSNDPEQEYFSDGMMDEIQNHLFQIGDLQVTSRTSVMQYKGTTKSIPQIAKELGVRTILEGSVRKYGNRIRITAQLIDGKTDKHLWSEIYERELKDVFVVQSDVAHAIASTLNAEITPEVKLRIESIPTNSLDAYDLYLRAFAIYNDHTNEGLDIAMNLLEEAIKIDPEFSEAYVMLAWLKILGVLWQARGDMLNTKEAAKIAKGYLDKALELNPYNYLANWAMYSYYLWFQWDFRKAEYYMEKCDEIRPYNAGFELLASTGRFEESLERVDYQTQLSPFWGYIKGVKIFNLFLLNRITNAFQMIDHVLESGLKDPYVYFYTAKVYLYSDRFEEAINVCERSLLEFPDLRTPVIISIEAMAYYHLGMIDKMQSLLTELKERSDAGPGGSPSFFSAMVYAQMGEIDTAFKWLEKAYEDHEVEMYWLKVEPPFEPLHSDPRWQVMLDKVGFPKEEI